ncbi:hypothetical protein [Robertkochia flava]|uniref:hypothetical protein n=1 Tax=Robertkochia flava TaxID=3447986 RepID=UPI001CCF05A2|nr:hypothetical protein [Robertkochia marina]
MSKRAIIQLFIGTLIIAGTLSLFNSYMAMSKMERIRKAFYEEAERAYVLEKREKDLSEALKRTQKELNKCKGLGKAENAR